MKRVDHFAASPKESKVEDGESLRDASSDFRSSIEIKAEYIPSWIICRICALIGSEGNSFEASFITERTSIGLNVALREVCEKTDSKNVMDEGLEESSHCFGIPEATANPCLGSGFLKGLKYNSGSYTASLSPI